MLQSDDDTVLSSELTVLNLPLGKDAGQVRMQLKKLSDNCGGKVVSVTGRCALIKFPNALSAARYCTLISLKIGCWLIFLAINLL